MVKKMLLEKNEELPQELLKFSEKFRKNNKAGFLAWIRNLKPCLCMVDDFVFKKDRIVIKSRKLRFEKGKALKASFITENEHYTEKCEFIYAKGILQKAEHSEIHLFPEKVIWSISFDISKFPEFPERIIKRWYSKKPNFKENEEAHISISQENEDYEKGSIEEAEKLFMEIKTPVIFASVDKDYAHATPMNWLWLSKEKLFWFNPAGNTKKIENLRANKNICFATLNNAKKNEKGFIVDGEIVKWEEGISGFLKNMLTKRRMLVEKSRVYFDARTLKFWIIYALHRDIYYSTLPWNAAFLRVKPRRIVYWFNENSKKEVLIK